MIKDDWPSTKALSVHNALRLVGRDMTREELVGVLRRGLEDDTVDAEYVETGVQFLIARGFASRVGPLIVSNRSVGQLVRADEDRELEPSHIVPRAMRPIPALEAMRFKGKGW